MLDGLVRLQSDGRNTEPAQQQDGYKPLWVHGRCLDTFYPRRACNSSKWRWMAGPTRLLSICRSWRVAQLALRHIIVFLFLHAVCIVDWIVASGRSFYSAAITWYKSDMPHLLGGYIMGAYLSLRCGISYILIIVIQRKLFVQAAAMFHWLSLHLHSPF